MMRRVPGTPDPSGLSTVLEKTELDNIRVSSNTTTLTTTNIKF